MTRPHDNRSMTAERFVLLRFVLLYWALFSAFGCASPFLPAFLAERGLGPEELGIVALRLCFGERRFLPGCRRSGLQAG